MTETSEEQQKAEPPAARPSLGSPAGTATAARTGIRQAAAAVRPQHRICAIIPVYDQPDRLADVVGSLRKLGLSVVLVDDGSHEPTRSLCDQLAAPQIKVIHHPQNRGKGAAVVTGFKAAARLGCTHALQIDADGQHDMSSVPAFLRLSQKFPHALICGCPVFDSSAPKARLWGRRITNFWCSVNSISLSFGDAMCGLRVYPLDAALAVCENARLGRRMDFDPEILVRLLWAGVRVKNVIVRVRYHTGGVSHFAPLKDNLLISAMHARLFVQMITRLPIIFWSRCCGWSPVSDGQNRPADSKTAQTGITSKKPAQQTRSRRPDQTPEAGERAKRALHAAEMARLNADRARAGLDHEPRANG